MTDLTAAVDRLIAAARPVGIPSDYPYDDIHDRDILSEEREALLAHLAASEARTAALEKVAEAAKWAVNDFLTYYVGEETDVMERLDHELTALAALDGPDAAEGEAGT
jgi:hypothetical protein